MPESHEQSDEAGVLTAAEVLAKLRISRRTLDRYVDRGALAAIRLPSGVRRFRRADVDALLETSSV